MEQLEDEPAPIAALPAMPYHCLLTLPLVKLPVHAGNFCIFLVSREEGAVRKTLSPDWYRHNPLILNFPSSRPMNQASIVYVLTEFSFCITATQNESSQTFSRQHQPFVLSSKQKIGRCCHRHQAMTSQKKYILFYPASTWLSDSSTCGSAIQKTHCPANLPKALS